ncbi:hypothetical protein BDA99DRAFT_3362 [Phascolomyces articulosus]|uniref:Rrn7/TAF1B N-terminal cyclin domain-containing protein n=1 Tax=Phascolomyces articulosus TaxID=60185 RepID=A0AAD5KBM0_9FUNG|nr:hypothetical protein BDA99DRAFT_3362 [Phascolomyces articulosus]
MRRRTPCERCGTRRFKKKSDGTMVCKNGHVLVGWVEETQDDDMVYMGKKLSRPKALKSVGHEQTRYTGIDRESAILQVCQNGLNVLIQYCVREFGFPDNIQKIAQDLWELYIIATGKMVTFDIFDQGEEDQRGPEDQQQQNHMSTENVLKLTPMPSKTLEDELGVDLDDDDNDVLHNHKNDKENKEEGTYEWPELRYAHTIIFLFLTFKWARLPVLFSDIRRWCKSLQLPYMDALYQIPDDIVRHLDRAFIYTLKYIPNMRSLYRDLRRFRICFEQECGVKFSNENIPAIVHRLYPHFGLPGAMQV